MPCFGTRRVAAIHAVAPGSTLWLWTRLKDRPKHCNLSPVPKCGQLVVQEALPVLGRMLALTGGDEELARLVLPLLRDTLASQTTGAEAEVRGGLLRALLRRRGLLRAQQLPDKLG